MLRKLFLAGIAAVLANSSGCITFTHHAIPASRLPNQFAAPEKSSLQPINFAILGSDRPEVHVIDAGDALAISIQGIVPPDSKQLPPVIQTGQTQLTNIYYPPSGLNVGPGTGLPIAVQADGEITLPLVGRIPVRGLTLSEVAEKIRLTYRDKEIVKEGNDQVNVTLLRSRVNRILVLREDIQSPDFVALTKGMAELHRRGSAQVVDLPIFESDILHALAVSGGLPGTDAHNEVWVLRKSTLEQNTLVQIQDRIAEGHSPEQVVKNIPAHLEAIRIPLKLCPDQPIPFTPEDVLLQDGDVVYIEPRREEYFYTGGLLPGGKIPMPRDEDLDILEAIALAQGSVGGLGGASSTITAVRSIGPIVPPSRALVLRKLPNGEQLPIRVDLARAMKNPRERIEVLPGDYIMMYYKPSEVIANSALNLFGLEYVID